jgi:hypothetical protein
MEVLALLGSIHQLESTASAESARGGRTIQSASGGLLPSSQTAEKSAARRDQACWPGKASTLVERGSQTAT